MARFLATIDAPLSCEDAFDALLDFSRCAEWDPSVLRAQRLTLGALAPGARFRVVVSAFGVPSALSYTLIAAERPHRIVLRAEQGPLVSLDEIAIAPRGGGVRVTYDALLTLSGAARLAEPVLGAWFQRSGARSAEGLRVWLARGAQPAPSAASARARKGTRARSRAQSRNVPANLR